MPLPDIPAGIETRCDAAIADLVAQLPALQGPRARYLQGILTPATTPADGSERAPVSSRKPTDQSEDWTGAGVTLPATTPCALAVDVYDGPSGRGYSVRAEIVLAGDRWVRVTHVAGLETWRERAWTKVSL